MWSISQVGVFGFPNIVDVAVLWIWKDFMIHVTNIVIELLVRPTIVLLIHNFFKSPIRADPLENLFNHSAAYRKRYLFIWRFCNSKTTSLYHMSLIIHWKFILTIEQLSSSMTIIWKLFKYSKFFDKYIEYICWLSNVTEFNPFKYKYVVNITNK